MELIKADWTGLDKQQFLNYLTSLKNPQKVEFFARVINTRQPILAIPTPAIQKIARDISKGNFLSFLKLNINDYYETTLLNGFLICKINDFETFKTYLIGYAKKIDNWACCDQLRFNINKNNVGDYFALSCQMFNKAEPFARRIGVRIWFKLISTDFLPKIFEIIAATNQNEQSYYVNMAIAWFLCECYIKQPAQTKQFLQRAKLNQFTLKKFVSKCCDSFRISAIDKQNLKNLIKNA